MPASPAWTKSRPNSRTFLVCAAFAVIMTTSCRVTDIPIWGPASTPSCFEVETARGISYVEDAASDTRRNRLDIFWPKEQKNCPVVVLVHGGAWMMGDNRCCGLYSSVGEFLASRGIVAVLPNYRLSPFVKHPEHIKDVARAVAWVHAHVGDYGGRPDQIFLMGHSAGGHLVSLLATDEQYLKKEGLDTRIIQGVICLSGVYHIPQGSVNVTLGGQMADSFRFDKMVPLRSPSNPGQSRLPGVPMRINVFGVAFGDDAEVREDASPINHVRPGLPPFLLFSADNDLPLLPAMAKDFHEELLKDGCDARLFLVAERNHNSIMFQAYQSEDPVAQMTLGFIRRHISASAAGANTVKRNR